ncbi:MAG: damage-inducible protein CinA [Methylophilaceae bacterium]|nr:MAG: damage-inducible protein CinA [Methylophilaceae bacterium]
MDTLVNLATQLGQALQTRGDMLALAESCTGGMVSTAVTDIAGSSAWFDRGFITYSNAAKQEMLGVSAKILAQHGAVSEETALAMALGALKNSQAHITASITGIAGPTGGSTDKPVGTVCFAWVNKEGLSITATEHYVGNREAVRLQAAIQSISGLLGHL